MALPIAAAVPLSAFLSIEPVIPIPTPSAPLPSSPMTLFALGTAARFRSSPTSCSLAGAWFAGDGAPWLCWAV